MVLAGQQKGRAPPCGRLLALGAAGTLRKAGSGKQTHSLAELDWEMKAIAILVGLAAAAAHATEPALMLLSGAALLSLASAIRRHMP